MAALPLSPKDNNYLTSNLVFNQLNQNAIDLVIDNDAEVEIVEQPQLLLDGCGRAYLSGKVKIIDATPAAGMKLFELPLPISIENDYFLPVSVTRSATYVQNTVGVQQTGAAISAVQINNRGSYTTNIVPVLNGDGSGATLVAHMRVKTITPVLAGQGYAPGDTVTFAGGTFGTRATATVSVTHVNSATVAAGGSGGTNGTQTVTGTTGTGTKFQASVTVAGGEITDVLSITVGGAYTVNPTDPTTEPVTGANLTGAQLNLSIGVTTLTALNVGDYTSVPANNVAQFSTTGSGTGVTAALAWELLSIVVSAGGAGYDDTSYLTFTGTFTTEADAELILTPAFRPVDVNLMTAATQDDIVNLNGTVFFVNSY